jgi:hypothetical protein
MTESGFTRNDWLRLLIVVGWLIVFVYWPRLVFAITLLGIGATFIAYNAMIFWIEIVRRDHASSVVPIFGGILAGIGIAILPVVGSWKWAWIPLLFDWGGLGMLYAIWKERRTGAGSQ